MKKREDFSQEVEERELYNGDKIVESIGTGILVFSAVLAVIALVFLCI